ncbi:MAG: HU family DNA-binding protein [Pseudodonghicola sp.]|nr:HU family DNA-binding protein [Pseudodonghicola sp.]
MTESDPTDVNTDITTGIEPETDAGAKGATPGRTAPDVAPQTAPVEPYLGQGAEPSMGEPDLRKKELIAAVLERCEVKRREAKPVIEAMLAVLGEALANGRGLNLEPLGKLRINRSEEKRGRRIVVCKLRQGLDVPALDDTDDSDELDEQ